MNAQSLQWIRKASLFIGAPQKGADLEDTLAGNPNATFFDHWHDLSQLRFTFMVSQGDSESPNNCVVRVYNMSAPSIQQVLDEFSFVVLQAGYKDAQFGVIFRGTIKQFRIGRENGVDSYLDILAADADIGYNFGMVNQTLASGWTHEDITKAAATAMGVNVGSASLQTLKATGGTIPNPRGKVMFGMARQHMRDLADTLDASWSIQDGRMQILPNRGYLPGEAVVINRDTGMIGVPEQTAEGISVRCLLNPKLRIGGLVRIDTASINRLVAQRDNALPAGQQPFDRFSGIQFPALPSKSGLYRLYVVQHTRRYPRAALV